MSETPDILRKIVTHKRGELATVMAAQPLAEVRARLADLEDQPRGFCRALRAAADSGWTAVIAEVKKGSPSKGIIRSDFDPLEIAETYRQNGAACLSVLTDHDFFGGSPDDLVAARAATGLPALRKDFTVADADVYDARAMGADAVLLIVAALTDAELTRFVALARRLGVDALVEVHDEGELARALSAGATLVGVNQRDLHSFAVDRERALRVGAAIPEGVVAVAESGITGPGDLARLADAGFRAALVGEALVTAPDARRALLDLRGVPAEAPTPVPAGGASPR